MRLKKHPFYSCFQTRGTKKQKVFLMSVGFIKTKNRGRLGKRVRSILHRVAMFCIVVSVKSVTQALFFWWGVDQVTIIDWGSGVQCDTFVNYYTENLTGPYLSVILVIAQMVQENLCLITGTVWIGLSIQIDSSSWANLFFVLVFSPKWKLISIYTVKDQVLMNIKNKRTILIIFLGNFLIHQSDWVRRHGRTNQWICHSCKSRYVYSTKLCLSKLKMKIMTQEC